EALVERGVRHARRAAVEPRELGVADLAEPANAVTRRLDPAPAASADDAQLGVGAPDGFDQTIEVLARLERADREHVLPLLRRALLRELVLDRVRDDMDPFLGDAEQLRQLASRELGHGNQLPRRP